MASPTSTHIARYHPGNAESADDGRLFSHVFERNGPPIIAALTPWLASRTGPVLEIGSGTGQHAGACRLAFPQLAWHPSDPDPLHRASVAAWADRLRLPHVAPLDIDASADWPLQVAHLGPLTAVVSMNVIHIAPFAVAQGIVAGAGRSLGQGGLLIFYGPFRVNGQHVGEGNRNFDSGLRADNPDWGIRDTEEIGALARDAGLEFAALQSMPANNRLLVFRKG